MHHFKAKGGTVFNFNSDLSGLARLQFGEFPLGNGSAAAIPAADLLEFVDWYRKTPGYGAPEPEDDPNLKEAARLLWRCIGFVPGNIEGGMRTEVIEYLKKQGLYPPDPTG